jgi:hypothetical protein
MENTLKSFAPVILFVFNRPEHTALALASLSKCKEAPYTDVFIFSDGPRSEADVDLVNQVRQRISEASGFRSVTTTERIGNFGLAKSVITGVSSVFENYGRVIVLEDDLEVSPNFLGYMNRGLEFYYDHESVFSIGAYQFPTTTMSVREDYEFDTYLGVRCCSWGWATWKDRWTRIQWDVDVISASLKNSKIRKEFNKGGRDLSELVALQKAGTIDSWAIRFSFAHFSNSMYCVYPTKSLVRNIGLDGTGIHCGVDPSRVHKSLDLDWVPTRLCPSSELDDQITRDFSRAFNEHIGILTNISKMVPKRLKPLATVCYQKIRRASKR